MDTAFREWMAALEARHLADLRVTEVTRALRALSSAYVERRRQTTVPAGGRNVHGALDSAGKRAAFALFYAPLHFIAVTEVVRARGAGAPPPKAIVDLGCGTGVAGAAWALACQPSPSVIGIDRHPWAVDEARWTYQQLGVDGRAHQGDVTKSIAARRGHSVVAAYVLNELPDEARSRVEAQLLETAEKTLPDVVLVSVGDGRVHFQGHNVFLATGEVLVIDSVLRFRTLEELHSSLAASRV